MSETLTVGVIFSPADLARAVRMRRLPDLFELRLDALAPQLDSVRAVISRLTRPLILTARDPREGGVNALPLRVRRELLERFLPSARYVDVELRSASKFGALFARSKVKRILSFHDFSDTPTVSRLSRKADAAAGLSADIFKVATRVDTSAQLDRLLKFFDDNTPKLPIAAMGIGALGAQSRIELARRGSCLNYAHLGEPQADGQLSLRQLQATTAPSPLRM